MDRTRALALTATSLGFAVVQLDVSVVNVAIAPIGKDLGGSTADLQWVVNAYTLAFAALILSAGALGDRVGARRLFVGGFALFTTASVACGLSPTLGVLLTARAVQGIGAAVLVPSSLSLLSHTFDDPDERSRAIGTWAAGASLALAGGPLVGGLLSDAVSWRAIFLINVPLGLLGMVLTLRSTGETTRSADRTLDPVGQVCGAGALAALAFGVVRAGERGLADATALLALALGAALLTAFVRTERRRGDRAMLPPRLFRSSAFSRLAAIGLLLNVAVYGVLFVLSLFFQRAQGMSPLRAGLAFVPLTALVGVANISSSRLSARLGRAAVVRSGAALAGVGCAGLLAADRGTSYAVVVLPLAALGLGVGVAVPAMTSGLLAAAPLEQAGVASGTLNTARQSGSVLGVSAFGALASTHVVTGLRQSLGVSVALCAVVVLLGAGIDDGG